MKSARMSDLVTDSGLIAANFGLTMLCLTSKLCRFSLALSAESLSKTALHSWGKKEIICKKIAHYPVSGLYSMAVKSDKNQLFY
jgi:hypothetical protein